MEQFEYVVVGSGFSGAVMAERIASQLGKRALVVEKRSAIGGNSRSKIDPETGIECHVYGSHIFHTSSEKVWKYITQFGDFTTYRHKVLIRSKGKTYFMPINLKTLNDFYGKDLPPEEAKKLMTEEIAKAGIREPENLEEKAISLIGRPLYETFIEGYTRKQWGRDPKELPAEIITRLPVRTNFNADYFGDPWQGVPREGYFRLFERILDNPKIEVRLNTDFRDIREELPAACKIFYTGMIDEFFDNCFGALEWRSLRFEWETLPVQDYQGTTVVNDGNPEVPYTRIHEFKHYHPERTAPFESGRTVICKEFPQTYQPGMEAYYPVNSGRNQKLLAKYQELAAQNPNVRFGGRLGRYRYWNMDKAIEAVLDLWQGN